MVLKASSRSVSYRYIEYQYEISHFPTKIVILNKHSVLVLYLSLKSLVCYRCILALVFGQ